MNIERISVIGGGAWGTALATMARAAGADVTIWALEKEVAASINEDHCNRHFLPDVMLDPAIRATNDLGEAAEADALLLVAPAQHMRTTMRALKPGLKAGTPLVICSKGIEESSGALLSEVLAEELPAFPLAVLSGPNFAIEVARGLPAAATLACADEALGAALVAALARPAYRLYQSTDPVGAQIGGAVKNVLAIACGIVEGRQLGQNARAALITRGMAEILRFGMAKGGKAETMMGLSGLGDLVLTCNSESSRNFSLGSALGRGETLEQIMERRRTVAEGVFTAAAVSRLSTELKLDMPICQAIDAILNKGRDIDDVIRELLDRPFRDERLAGFSAGQAG